MAGSRRAARGARRRARLWHRLVNRSALHVQLVRSTLKFVGFAPVRSDTFYGARALTAADRERAMVRMREAGARDARRLAS